MDAWAMGTEEGKLIGDYKVWEAATSVGLQLPV